MKGDWVKRGLPNAPVLVFIHGVLSSGESCWRHPSGANWPEIAAKDPDMSALSVYVFTYRTGFFSGNYGLVDAANALKEHFSVDGVNSSKELVFVCHSMGGIVARRYLVSQAAELISRQVQIALFLLASPSLGSDYANLVSPLAKIVGHLQVAALRSARSNAWLHELDHDFRNLKERALLPISGKELIEDRFVASRWLLRKQVVEPFSGACYFAEPYKVPGSDHFSIVKIENEHAIQHRQLKHFVAEWRLTKTRAGTAGDSVKQSRINPIESGQDSLAISSNNMLSTKLQDIAPGGQPSQTSLSAVEEAIAPFPHASLEAIMGDPATKHLVDRFWDLDASDRREIALELGLISEGEVDLPELQRYGVALIRASERNLLDQLEKLVKVRE
ncbi:alpha/beta fold hydrolase [Pseudorhodobacter sp. MZDSW-24AT]|uniref:alpha/beta fold hydrolase n=1 Tax=Pseudorhodobacter sp. MZDSW-24AT TaxID=2052957 RepID=UPI0012FDCA31|nr:alpha/beta fold hydrolase [Pseudorhodobacter sp. MZDSW-24AT]